MKTALRHPDKLFGRFQTIPVDGKLQFQRDGRRDEDDTVVIARILVS